jgi:hypothetical protein
VGRDVDFVKGEVDVTRHQNNVIVGVSNASRVLDKDLGSVKAAVQRGGMGLVDYL